MRRSLSVGWLAIPAALFLMGDASTCSALSVRAPQSEWQVPFATGDAILSQDGKATVDRAVRIALDNSYCAEVTGRDDGGPDDEPIADPNLSRQRAQRVADELTRGGVDCVSVRTFGAVSQTQKGPPEMKVRIPRLEPREGAALIRLSFSEEARTRRLAADNRRSAEAAEAAAPFVAESAAPVAMAMGCQAVPPSVPGEIQLDCRGLHGAAPKLSAGVSGASKTFALSWVDTGAANEADRARIANGVRAILTLIGPVRPDELVTKFLAAPSEGPSAAELRPGAGGIAEVDVVRHNGTIVRMVGTMAIDLKH